VTSGAIVRPAVTRTVSKSLNDCRTVMMRHSHTPGDLERCQALTNLAAGATDTIMTHLRGGLILFFANRLDFSWNQKHSGPVPRSMRGVSADRHDTWSARCGGRDGVAAREVRADDRCQRGRRRRVVLTPRRWCQVARTDRATTGARKPGPRGERV
jgi:hypothetical protein